MDMAAEVETVNKPKPTTIAVSNLVREESFRYIFLFKLW